MVLANIFNINDKNILATASITITDQTDAATLAGGISVVSGGKNQIYMTGSSTPFSPDWTKKNLVLRPYLYASTIVRGGDKVYNPDLFDTIEYPVLSSPNDNNVTKPYINQSEINWYLRDTNGVETLIESNSCFSFEYVENDIAFTDKRFLVVKDNFVAKDSFATIICRFVFYDPFAKLHVKQSYEIDLSCLSTGQGTNQLLLQSVNGTTIYNSYPTYIDLYATYFKDGIEIDVNSELLSQHLSSSLYWYIRSASGNGWSLLDASKQDEYADLFEIFSSSNYDPVYNRHSVVKTYSTRGGFYIRIHPALIQGSSAIKAVFYSSNDNKSYTAIEMVYDMTDEVQAYIHSSNGDKIYQGINSSGTTLTCMLKYAGQLLETNDSKYDNFEYYWFKMSSDGSRTWNIWLDDNNELMFQELVEGNENIQLKNSSRILPIDAEDVDNVNMFQCVVVDKVANELSELRSRMILNSPSEEDMITASVLNGELNAEQNADEILNTAYEINAMNIASDTSLKD